MKNRKNVIGPHLNRHREALKVAIEATADLEYNWDDSEGYAPDAGDISNAVKFMDVLPPDGIPHARKSVSGEGKVGFRWHMDGYHLNIGFYQGRIYYYGYDPDDKETHGEMDFAAVLPQKIKEFMDRMLP